MDNWENVSTTLTRMYGEDTAQEAITRALEHGQGVAYAFTVAKRLSYGMKQRQEAVDGADELDETPVTVRPTQLHRLVARETLRRGGLEQQALEVSLSGKPARMDRTGRQKRSAIERARRSTGLLRRRG